MEPEVFLNYSLEFVIGTGTFSSVYLAVHNKTGTKVCIKMIPKKNCQDTDRHKLIILREINIMKRLKHPFITDLYEVIETENNVYMILEFAQNGTLLDMIKSRGIISEGDASIIFAQLLIVVQYLHKECNIAHRDIKAENIAFDSNRNIRLLDFGLSNSPDEDNLMVTQCGSISYAAPEMILGQKYTYAADIWSMGVVLFGMVCGYLPFQDPNFSKLAQKIVFKDFILPTTLSVDCRDLIRRMLLKSPGERITLEEIIKHKWVKESYDHVANDVSKFSYNMDFISRRIQTYNLSMEEVQKKLDNGVVDQDTITYHILCRENQVHDFRQSMLNIYKLGRKYSSKGSDKLPALNPKEQSSSFKPRPAIIPGNSPCSSAKRRKMPRSLVYTI